MNRMATRHSGIWRGDARRQRGGFKDYTTEISEGMVVLDAVHQIQAEQAPDLACRWNCKAGKCGSCSAEINGKPQLMCMTRLNTLDLDAAGDRRADAGVPADQGPGHRRLVELPRQEGHQEVHAAPARRADGTWRMAQRDVDRVQEFRKCIECFLCQDVCHVLRDHDKHDGVHRPALLRLRRGARDAPARHRRPRARPEGRQHGIGYCNITKCCTTVCPEHIHITDNAIIPLKERVVDRFYDPVTRLLRMVTG